MEDAWLSLRMSLLICGYILSVGGVYGSDKPIYQEKQASDDQVSGRTVCKLHILLQYRSDPTYKKVNPN